MNLHRGLLIVVAWALASLAQAEDSSEQEVFFESKIRPLLVNNCVECHGPKKQESGLRLDQRAAMLQGSDTGKVLIPGDPSASRLVQVVHFSEDDIQMPPSGKLPEGQIAAIEQWVRDGAYWPLAAGEPVSAESMAEKIVRLRDEHWSFRSVKKPEPPAVAHATQPIDRFVQARLQDAGLKLSQPAELRTLIRRVTFDLTGLPPTAEEVDAFLADESADAYEKLVDGLLARPQFGEAWARHWLDIARYADTKGYVFNTETRYPYAYTYRDYVIRALNADKPYDRFVMEQLAADQLELEDDPQAIAALGFLTVGRRFRNNAQDVIDDRIDVVTRGLMGLTAACARCHDHKYDPFPTEDYYSLYGVFASVDEPEDLPLVGQPADTPEYRKYKQELDKRQAAHDNFVAQKHRELLADTRKRTADYLARVVKNTGSVPDDYGLSLQKDDLRPRIIDRWRRLLERRAKPDDAVFAPWAALSQLPTEGFAAQAAAWLAEHAESVNPRVHAALTSGQGLQSMYDVASAYGQLLAKVDQEWQNQRKQRPDAAELPEQADEALRQVLYAPGSPTDISQEEAIRDFDRVARNKTRQLASEVQAWQVQSPHAPPRAMIVRDKATPVQPVVLIRGNPGRRGDEVPRRFPRILAGLESPAFEHGSGRLDLARSIVDPNNPLTARVFVNRVWLHLFGAGLVETPSDFGLRSEPPTHPQLLDWLAATFVEEGWSVKRLIRTIVLSQTYRQSSNDNMEARQLDPGNRLLWRQRIRRLNFEQQRDAMLAASGRLDRAQFGRGVDITQPAASRRTIYGTVNRNNLPSLYRTFDFASPDSSTAKRPQTIVPQQALFGLNSPFVMQQAEALAARSKTADDMPKEDRLRSLYHFALAREPSDQEAQQALAYLDSQSSDEKYSRWARLAQVLLLTNEFTFID